MPDLLQVAMDCERFGAQGITVHPRPDQRHIRYADVYNLKKIVTTEFNIEGNPSEKKFVELVLAVKPAQVTLVPDTSQQLTSNHGWDTIQHQRFLCEIISVFKKAGIRTSVFVNPDEKMIEGAKNTGADRIELYTESYAQHYTENKQKAIENFIIAAHKANELGIEINAGHDLNLENLRYFKENIPGLKEVSIGHALISDALYFGLQNTISLYLQRLQ
ncbi:MAG: Pyridoxine 5'-phosphate synthase [Flavobacteriales bacterium]|nr:Pyridoxine 5'-phosphate synthase [Flavobacteriales bacterium]